MALGGRRGMLLLRRAESWVLPAKRQQLLRALPENRFCHRVSRSTVKTAGFIAIPVEEML